MAISIVLVVKVIRAFHEKGTFAPLAPLSKGQEGPLPPALPLSGVLGGSHLKLRIRSKYFLFYENAFAYPLHKQKWKNELLFWNDADFGIKRLAVPAKQVWTPTLMIDEKLVNLQ